MVNFSRWAKHLFMPPWAWRRAFPQAALDAIESAIRQSETRHNGEIRFAIETSLAPAQVWRGMSGRERAIEIFSELRVWDTEHNSGVLIYLLLADHDIEIVADRGIAAQVEQSAWEAVAQAMEAAFRQGEFERGVLDGIEQVSALLAVHVPPQDRNPNELANRPAIIRS
ncbi:TPM domain-containing protein [Thiobacillus sp.]|uniref:TPM domain-containing protein n=1 Tax=Thiobacillus sp. TaxID=924 RepID=UPI00286EA88B|nr:TPM domain-containing protein [Thiobacillus sp.]